MLLSDVQLNGYPTDNINYGMDLAVFTAVPEPSSALLTIAGLFGLAAVVRRQRHKKHSLT